MSVSPFSRRHLIGLGAVAAMLLAPAALRAQQMAATDLTEDGRHAYITAHCGPIERANAGCVAQSSLEFSQAQLAQAKQQLKAAEQGIALERELQRCGAFLRGKRDSGVIFDRKITRENICPYARELGMQDGPG